jgi:hypothetical protein
MKMHITVIYLLLLIRLLSLDSPQEPTETRIKV